MKEEIKEFLPKTRQEKAIELAKECAINNEREIHLFFDGKRYIQIYPGFYSRSFKLGDLVCVINKKGEII